MREKSMKKMRWQTLIAVVVITCAGYLGSYITLELLPKDAEGFLERPIDLFWIVMILGITGGVSLGLLANIALEEYAERAFNKK